VSIVKLLRWGDYIVILGGSLLCAGLAWSAWGGAKGEALIIRSEGRVVAKLMLYQDQKLGIPGPLGETIVEVASGRARVASDPSPRQLCVKQGWLQRAGESAVCLPNRVSVEIAGGSPRYDSLNY
jgi:hypothetical protein